MDTQIFAAFGFWSVDCGDVFGEELDLPQKMARLRQWCEDATEAANDDGGPAYQFVYVDQQGFEQHKPSSFAGLTSAFREYQES